MFERIRLANCVGQYRHRGSHGVRRGRDVDVPTCPFTSQTSWNEAAANQTPQGCFPTRQPLQRFGDLQRGSLPQLLLGTDRDVAIESIASLTSRGPAILPTGRLECESHMAVMVLASFTVLRPPWPGQCRERFCRWPGRRGWSLHGLSRATEPSGLDQGPKCENTLFACVSQAHASIHEGSNGGISTTGTFPTMPTPAALAANSAETRFTDRTRRGSRSTPAAR